MKTAMSDLERFANEVLLPDQINLTRAALIMGEFEYPALDIAAYVGQLDRLAETARRYLRNDRSQHAAQDLADFLFKHVGFVGNYQNYHDPKNSFFNEVIDRRVGIPITLSLVYLEVASRLGFEVEGIGLPGHFIVRVTCDPIQLGESDHIYLDPFNGGTQMSIDDCRQRVKTLTEGKLNFQVGFLNPVGPRHILTRMLNNLKNVYASQNDLERTLAVIERLLIINPLDPAEMRNQAIVYTSLGQRRRAVSIYERYLDIYSNAPDAKKIKETIVSLAHEVARWN
ncbi:MAG: tetratricopeptide repeat protein [Anaerolineae bacterium]|nr:tetratricopeptide repeat protein [Anaerolineae bacterium]